jgi:hypothetical protein
MFHVRVRGDRRRLEEAALDLSEETGVWMFGRLGATDSPFWQRAEITCADATMELEDDEIASLFELLLQRAS